MYATKHERPAGDPKSAPTQKEVTVQTSAACKRHAPASRATRLLPLSNRQSSRSSPNHLDAEAALRPARNLCGHSTPHAQPGERPADESAREHHIILDLAAPP